MASILLSGQIVTVPEKVANAIINIQRIQSAPAGNPIATSTHPEYDAQTSNWYKWRLTYDGGDEFVDEYLKKFSKREDSGDFNRRREMTPVPAFAAGAVNEIKNAIFERTTDITRTAGPISYIESCKGEQGGVDKAGGTMNWFIGHYILPELLTMRKVGVYVDNEELGPTLADNQKKHPYIYHYKAENIQNWSYLNKANKEFRAIKLREFVEIVDPDTGLVSEMQERFKHIYLNADGFVTIQIYDENGVKVGDPRTLTIKRIPFVCFEITESLLKNVANHQIALLNLESSDISYGLRGNVPFYTEQRDSRGGAALIKAAQQQFREQFQGDTLPGGVCPPELKEPREETETGTVEGRIYGKDLERPGFIAPPAEPLRVSMEKQKSLKEDVRLLVHLALSNVQAKMASADSKLIDQQGLAAGLAYIGLELEHGERRIADYWAVYTGDKAPSTVNYPKQYSLKSESEIADSVKKLQEVRDEVPSNTFKKEINKKIARTVIGSSVSLDVVQTIEKEIQDAEYYTSNADVLGKDVQSGLVGLSLASKARGYPESEVEKAKADRADMAARIMKAQTEANPAARGAPELAPNPAAAADEKIGKKGRGAAQ